MRLTIGFPTYDDFAGMELSLQPLAMFHDLADVELVVVDNHPTGDEAQRRLERYARSMGARYVSLVEPVGTAAPRDLIFKVATGDVVIVADGHVILSPRTIPAVRGYFADAAHSRDIVQGPLLRSARRTDGRGLAVMATHYADVWRGGMWGVWAQAWRCATCRGDWHFDALPRRDASTELRIDDRGRVVRLDDVVDRSPHVEFARCAGALGREVVHACPRCGRELPTQCTEAEHVHVLEQLGFERRAWNEAGVEPFDIPGMGLGMFAMRRDAWPQFAAGMIGFGGGELHLHELVRRNGGRSVCLPDAAWWHRFERDKVPYPLQLWHKVRNYVLWRRRLDMPLEPVYEHFVSAAGSQINQAQWEYLLEAPQSRTEWPAHLATRRDRQPAPVSSYDALARSNDLAAPHMATIRSLARECDAITIVGKRPHWVAAATADCSRSRSPRQPGPLVRWHDAASPPAAESEWITRDDSDALTAPLSPCDLLILDTVHSGPRLADELARWAPSCRRWIAIYGTARYGATSEDGESPGLLSAIDAFVGARPQWHRTYVDQRTSGLTVLSCSPGDPDLDAGPGAELHALLATLGITPTAACDCEARMRRMNAWGVAGCRRRRDQIVAWLREGAPRWGWAARLSAAALAVASGVAWRLSPTDPYGSLVDEAIRRASVSREMPA